MLRLFLFFTTAPLQVVRSFQLLLGCQGCRPAPVSHDYAKNNAQDQVHDEGSAVPLQGRRRLHLQQDGGCRQDRLAQELHIHKCCDRDLLQSALSKGRDHRHTLLQRGCRPADRSHSAQLRPLERRLRSACRTSPGNVKPYLQRWKSTSKPAA